MTKKKKYVKKMAKRELKTYKFDSIVTTDDWVVAEEFVAEEDIVIVGFGLKAIAKMAGASAFSKSGTTAPGDVKQKNVWHYQEECGPGVAGAEQGSVNNDLIFPADCRPELDEGERIYYWVESGDTSIHHALMWYYDK